MASKDDKAKEAKLYAILYRYILADAKDITVECTKHGEHTPYPLKDTYDNYNAKGEKVEKTLETYATLSDESKQILGILFNRVVGEFDQVTDVTAFDHVSIVKVSDANEAEIRNANRDASPAALVKLITAELYRKRMTEILKVLEQYNDDAVAGFMFVVNNSNMYKIQSDSTLDLASDPEEWVNAKIAGPLHRFKAREVLVGTVARLITEFLKVIAYLASRRMWFTRSHNYTKDEFLGLINQQGASFTLIIELTNNVRVKVTKPRAKKAATPTVEAAIPATTTTTAAGTTTGTATGTADAATPAGTAKPADAAITTADLGAFNAANLLGITN